MIAIVDYDAGNIRSVENAMKVLGEDAVLTGDPNVIADADRVILPGVGAFGDAMERIRARGLESVLQDVCRRGTPFLGICLGLQLLFDESEESPGVKGLSILPGRIVRFPADMPEGSFGSSDTARSGGGRPVPAYDSPLPAAGCKGADTHEPGSIGAGKGIPPVSDCIRAPGAGAAAGCNTAGAGIRYLKVPEIGWNDLSYPDNGNSRRLFRNVPEHSHVYFVHSYYLEAADPEMVAARSDYGIAFDASVEAGNIFACQFHPEKSERIGMQILRNFLSVPV